MKFSLFETNKHLFSGNLLRPVIFVDDNFEYISSVKTKVSFGEEVETKEYKPETVIQVMLKTHLRINTNTGASNILTKKYRCLKYTYE